MKKQVLAFVSIAQFADNQPGSISAVGELSTWSQTYSLTKGEYAYGAAPGYFLTTFSVSDVANGEDTTLNSGESSLYIRVVQACVNYAETNPLPLDPYEFRNSIQIQFDREIESLEFGDMVQGPRITLPAWVMFKQQADEKNDVQIWIADNAFKAEYPNYDITIIPPLPDLNLFAGNWQIGASALSDWPNSRLVEAVQEKKNENPETYLRVFEYDFLNIVNVTQKIPTTWYALIYGQAGNEEDVVKDTIIKLLVETTGKEEAYWEVVFPELFKRTEFILYPRWENISVPNISNLTALYSPFTALAETQDYLVERTLFYPEAHVRSGSFVFPVTYKSIAVAGVNGLNNLGGQKTIWQAWPDYIAVGTSSLDFQRMQPLTQDWVHLMIKIISAAETATSTSSLPMGIRRVTRNGRMYLASTFNKASYLVNLRRNEIRG